MLKRIIEELEDFIPYIVPIILITMPIMLAITITRVETKNSNNPVYNIGSRLKFYEVEETYKDKITEDSYWIKKENVPESLSSSIKAIAEYNGYLLISIKEKKE